MRTFAQPRCRPLCVVVWALVLKAALPLLAAVAAGQQGLPVGEVCTVYGVNAADRPLSKADHAAGGVAAHGGDRCALTALSAMATPGVAHASTPPVAAATASPSTTKRPAIADDCARWAAQRDHGPPRDG